MSKGNAKIQAQSESIFHLIMVRLECQRQNLALVALVFVGALNVGLDGCAPLRPLQYHPQSRSQSQVPTLWFQPTTPPRQQKTLVGMGVPGPSASRLYQYPATPTAANTSISSSWSQLMTQAAQQLQQFTWSGSQYNSIYPGPLPALSLSRNSSDPVTVPKIAKSLAPQRRHGQSQPSSGTCPPSDQEKNKILVTTFYQQTFGDHNLENLHTFVHPNLIQHNPKVGDGLEGFVTFLVSMNSHNHPHRLRPKMKLDFRRVSAEGDLVWVHLRLPLLGRQFAVMDLFRIECGKIAEHWDVVQEITGKVLSGSKNGHPFF